MKRYIKTAYVISFVALALAGCSKTDEFQHNPDSALQIESVSGISPFDLMQNQASKAVITGDSLPGDEAAKGIGLFVTAEDGSAYAGHDSGYSNVKYTYNGSKWNTTTPIYLSGSVGKLYGYFPYNSEANDLRAIPVQSSLNGTDYLYAEPQTVSHSNKTVSLQMNHALSRLQLTIKKGANFTADAPLSKITLKSTSIDATGTLDLTDGTITPSKKSGETGIVELATDGEITAQGIEKDILIVPADNTEGKKDIAIFLLIDGKSAGITLSGENGIDIRSGIQNNVTLTIEDTGIKVTGVDVGLWGDGGSQTIQVGGHTVTVKLDEGVEGIEKDVMVIAYEDNGDVIIKATSIQKGPLTCNVGGSTQCERVKDNDIYTFIISNISSNVEAVLSYSKVTISVSCDLSKGDVWIGDDENKTSGQFYFGQQVVIHAAPKDKFRLYRWNDNIRETRRTFTVAGEDDAEYSASFISSDLIPGLFTVNSDGKQVFFSKGNLWCSTDSNNPQASDFHFETNQYDTTPSSEGDRVRDHISHFMWCSTAEQATALQYNTPWDVETSFFAGKDFTVNGVNTWCTLTGGDKGEWKYLINKDNECGQTIRSGKYMYGVPVCHHANCLILLPDDWKWGENSVGDNWQREYSESTTVKWSTMENAGAVCLPAAGYRNGYLGDTYVNYVGNLGYYWSASPYDNYYAYDLNFLSDNVYPNHNDYRYNACAVRLVTDVQ